MLDKVNIAIERIKSFEPEEGYYLAFSGGKDSCVIKALSDMAGVKYDAHYSVTTIDPPDLVYFIRKHHPDVIFERPKRSFLTEMVERGFPMRMRRWCCSDYKEKGGEGRVVMMGLRNAEGRSRSRRKMVEHCQLKGKKFVNPIIDWTDRDVWLFMGLYKIPYCSLYDEGWNRIGCLMCPLATAKHRITESKRYPRYTEKFREAFRKLYKRKKEKGSKAVDRWKDGDEMFDWWLGIDKEANNE